ncbi:MAG: drug/metabolite transporter (DMT)-like permease [bacterium]|jgi:drug/metabolite transporter (DMT)-like permease
MNYIFFSVICFLWGSSFILMKKASLVFGAISISNLRVVGGAVALLLIMLFAKQAWQLGKKHLRIVLLIGFLGNALPFTLQPYLIQKNGSVFVAMMVCLVPLFTVLISMFFLGKKSSKQQLIGILGGFLCLLLLLGEGLSRNFTAVNLLLNITIPLCYAISNVCIKHYLEEIPPLQLTFALLFVAGVITLPFSLEFGTIDINQYVPLAVFSVLVLGVLGTGIAAYLFLTLIQKDGPLFAGMVTYVIPVIAIVWGWLDSEKITSIQLISMAGIIFSVFLVQSKTNLFSFSKASS